MFLGFTANDEAGLPFQLRTDVDCKYQPPCFIGDRQAPFLAGPELSVDVPQKIAGKVGRFFPSGFVIRELSGYRRLVWFKVENVEAASPKNAERGASVPNQTVAYSRFAIERFAAFLKEPLTSLDKFPAYTNQGTRLLKGARQARDFPGLRPVSGVVADHSNGRTCGSWIHRSRKQAGRSLAPLLPPNVGFGSKADVARIACRAKHQPKFPLRLSS